MEANVSIIPATCSLHEDNEFRMRKTRVGAYCRVSTSHVEQLNSFYNQIAHYVGYIEEHEEWEFVDFYADEGLSGTKAWTRNEFNRLLNDCRDGRLDLVLVKSVSRFARNVVDCLSYLRELRKYNVDVYFENEKIHSMDMASEFLLSIHAMHAQEQSISISNNQRWAINKRMKNGLWLPTYVGYGYQIIDNEVVKNQENEHVIELIKHLYLNGYSAQKIVKYLMQNKIPGISKRMNWNENTIIQILTDPFYRGDLIAQKTYTTDTFPFERRKNRGEKDKYIYKEDHPAYISDEEGKRIDEIMSRRTSNSFTISQFQNRDCYSGKIFCSSCGGTMKRVIVGKDKKIGYSCKLHIKDANACHNKTMMKSAIEKSYLRMMNLLKFHKRILDKYLQDLAKLDKCVRKQSKAKQLLYELEKTKKQIHKTVLDYNQGCHEFAFYVQEIQRLKAIQKQIKEAMLQERVEIGYQEEIKKTKELQKLLLKMDYMVEFEDEIFSLTIDKIMLSNQTEITFILKNGLELTEWIEK